MNTIDVTPKKNPTRLILAIFALIGIVGWFLAGAPIPGRYQIVGPAAGDRGITMVDTMTGRLHIFVARRAGSAETFPDIETIELTK